MEHTYSYCGNCAHFEACDFIMTTYADGHGMNKCAPACGHYAIEFIFAPHCGQYFAHPLIMLI